MATEKVGVYRKYRGPVPADADGRPMPKKEWVDRRPFSWAVRWFGTDGKRYSKSFKTRKEAERFAEAKQQDVRQGKADPPARKTLREFYWEHKKLMVGKVSKSTLNLQLATLALLAEKVGWECDLKRLNSKDIEEFSAHRIQAGRKGTTVNKEVRALRRLFNLAIDRHYLPRGSNPAVGVTKAVSAKKAKRYCSVQQFEAIFGKAPSLLWRALLVVLYTAGLRLREAMHLTWNNIDFQAEEVEVAYRDAKGYVQQWTPKDHEVRRVPLPKQAIALLTQLQVVAPVKCPYVFMEAGRWDLYRQGVDAGTWKTRDLCNNWLRRFKTLCRKADIPEFTIHDLRRSCITNWARKLPIHVTKELAGHSDIETTNSYYLSVQAEDLAKAKRVQTRLMTGLKDAPPTDPKLTHSTQKRDFPKRKLFGGVAQPPSNS